MFKMTKCIWTKIPLYKFVYHFPKILYIFVRQKKLMKQIVYNLPFLLYCEHISIHLQQNLVSA